MKDIIGMAKDNEQKPTTIVQIACIIALVGLSALEALNENFQVNIVVWAILGGLLLGVGGVSKIFGADRDWETLV